MQAELKYVEGIIRNNREKYGDDRRAELEGRTKENANYGLNREEIELLWECGIMPWDDYVDVSISKLIRMPNTSTGIDGSDWLGIP